MAAPAPSTVATPSPATLAPVPESKPTAPAGRENPPADLLEARLAATRDWLQAQPQATYSIQLMGADNAEQLRENLKAMAKFIEINDIYVYRTVARQKPSLTVLYGSFANPRAAREALDKLPESLKANRPLLRTVQGIRAEIRQHEAS
jgi:septal ring-binding cell division protein DamX